MSFWRKVSPGYIPPHIAELGDLAVTREKILQTIFLIFSILGFPPLLLAFITSLHANEGLLSLVYVAVYGLLFVMTTIRTLPYWLRANTFLLVVYLLGLSELMESGQLGDVRMFLIALAALTAVLFNFRSIVAVIAMGVLTIAGAGIYAQLSPDNLSPVLENLRNGTNWITSSATYLVIAAIISGSIYNLVTGLSHNLKKQSDLTQTLQDERDLLENRIEERTKFMAHQLVQLNTAAEISRTISGLNDPDSLLQQVVDLIRERFNLYYVGIFLIDTTRQYAVLRSGTGDAGKQMINQGHQLAISGSSMIGWSITNRKPRITLDVGEEAVRFSNPVLPLTRSELALPIIAHDHVLGAITIQSEKPNAFDENDITLLESVADSLAIALENDRLFNETRQSLEEIRTLNREYLQRAWAETIETYGALSYDYNNPTAIVDAEKARSIDVPLMLRDEVIGHITLEMDRPELNSDETAFIENVTTQTASALENARLLHETERRAVQEQKLNELTTRFSRAMSIDEILRAAAQELGQLPAVAEVSVQLTPAGTGQNAPAMHAGSGNGNGKEHAS